MNRFEEDLDAFKKRLRERATLIMKQHEDAQFSKRKRIAGAAGQSWGEGAARSAMRAQAFESAGPPLLVGWKEIAQTLGSISIRTAQRWEQNRGLPVRRVGATPIADPEAIREWKEQQLHEA
jgi:hypothetical protein